MRPEQTTPQPSVATQWAWLSAPAYTSSRRVQASQLPLSTAGNITPRASRRRSCAAILPTPSQGQSNVESLVEEKPVHEHVAECIQLRRWLDAGPCHRAGQAAGEDGNHGGHEDHLRCMARRRDASASEEKTAQTLTSTQWIAASAALKAGCRTTTRCAPTPSRATGAAAMPAGWSASTVAGRAGRSRSAAGRRARSSTFRLASSLSRNDRLSKLVDPTDTSSPSTTSTLQ